MMKPSDILRNVGAVCGAIVSILMIFGPGPVVVAGVISFAANSTVFWTFFFGIFGAFCALFSWFISFFE